MADARHGAKQSADSRVASSSQTIGSRCSPSGRTYRLLVLNVCLLIVYFLFFCFCFLLMYYLFVYLFKTCLPVVLDQPRPATGPRPSPTWRHSGPRWRKSHVSLVTDKNDPRRLCCCGIIDHAALLRRRRRHHALNPRKKTSSSSCAASVERANRTLDRANRAWPALIAVALQSRSLQRQLIRPAWLRRMT